VLRGKPLLGVVGTGLGKLGRSKFVERGILVADDQELGLSVAKKTV
jgi:hypothetical protein